MASIDVGHVRPVRLRPGRRGDPDRGLHPGLPVRVPVTVTATVTVTNSAGDVVATSSSPFVVNIPQPSGDKSGVTDDHSDVWSEESDSGSVA